MARIAIIDPPYGINVVQGSKAFGSVGGSKVANANVYTPIIGDDTTETAKDVYNLLISLGIADIVIWGGNYFTDFLPSSRCWLLWDKKGRDWDDNFSDFEVAWTSFNKPSKILRHTWMGMVQSGEREKRVHPTQKPAEMIADVIKMFSEEGDAVLDLFGGSGSTLIACEKTHRKCFMMELDTKYCDVIVKRYKTFCEKNDKVAVIKRNGEVCSDF